MLVGLRRKEVRKEEKEGGKRRKRMGREKSKVVKSNEYYILNCMRKYSVS